MKKAGRAIGGLIPRLVHQGGGRIAYLAGWQAVRAYSHLPFVPLAHPQEFDLARRFKADLAARVPEHQPVRPRLLVARNFWHQLWFPRGAHSGRLPPELLPELIETAGLENLDQALGYGRGVILVGAHLCMQRVIVDWLHHAHGLRALALAAVGGGTQTEATLARSRGLLAAMKLLAGGGVVQILPDGFQGQVGELGELLGRRRRFIPGFATLADISGAPILPGWLGIEAGGNLKLHFDQPFQAPPAKGGQEAIQAHYLEQYINWIEKLLLRAGGHYRLPHIQRFLRAPLAG